MEDNWKHDLQVPIYMTQQVFINLQLIN